MAALSCSEFAALAQVGDDLLDADRIPAGDRALVAQAVGDSPALAKLVAMREELRQLWTRTNVSAEQLVADLQAWCRRAEDSGIAALQEFSIKLRAAHA